MNHIFLYDPSRIDEALDCRSISFENPGGARGAGGAAERGRKGRASSVVAPGERIVLANLEGPGTVRRIWLTMDQWAPAVLRAARLEAFYDGMDEPSISCPVLDFFALPHGRPATFYSALVSAHEGRGFCSYIPLPFERTMRIALTNESSRHIHLFYQIDFTLEPGRGTAPSYLHVSFRRENPTSLKQDFVIADGLRGPGRFLGCSVGVRVLDTGTWYGEGEVKIYRDGDTTLPTICGTGLEDYVGSAWGLGPHYGPYSGAPLVLPAPGANPPLFFQPRFVSFYRWHLLDPIMFESCLRVTIQQIGFAIFKADEQAVFEHYRTTHPEAGEGWNTFGEVHVGLVERVDDYCAAAFAYCREAQAVSRYATALATADLERLPEEATPTISEDTRDAANAAMRARRIASATRVRSKE
jgi:hypothetical protein